MYKDEISEQISHLVGGILRSGYFPTFEDFYESYKVVSDKLYNVGASANDITATYQRWYAYVLWHNAGRAVFHISKSLVDLLRDTDLPEDMSTEFLRLPFESVALEVPKGTFTGIARDTTHVIVSHIPGERFRIFFRVDNDSVHYASLRPATSGDVSIKALVDETIERAFEGVPKDVAEEIRQNWAYDNYFKSDVFTFAVNAALYITSDGADVAPDQRRLRELQQKLVGLKGARRDNIERLLQKEKEHKIFICGKNLVPVREFNAELTKEGRELTKRFRVRGHWRNQPHGPARQERKHIWIAPHWKGPTYAELLGRNYVVE